MFLLVLSSKGMTNRGHFVFDVADDLVDVASTVATVPGRSYHTIQLHSVALLTNPPLIPFTTFASLSFTPLSTTTRRTSQFSACPSPTASALLQRLTPFFQLTQVVAARDHEPATDDRVGLHARSAVRG